MRKWILPIAFVFTIVGAAWAQSPGGAFLPTFNYVVTGQWTWGRLTPWVVRSAPNGTGATFGTSVVFTAPTANRTETHQNASGTVLLGDAAYKHVAGRTNLGTNPTSIATGLSALTSCSVTLVNPASSLQNNGVILSEQLTAVAGRLDIFQWLTSGAAASGAEAVAYACDGTA